MSGRRDILFTKVDEAALSDVIREKYPNVKFFEDRDWYIDSTPPFLESIDKAATSGVYISIPNEEWRPRLEKVKRRTSYRIANFPEPCGYIHRSSCTSSTKEYDLEWINLGAIHIFYYPSPSKTQLSFQRAIWRRFEKIATWRLEPFDLETQRALDWEKTDKRLWAGNDAIRWANEHPLRHFEGNGNFKYRPYDWTIPTV